MANMLGYTLQTTITLPGGVGGHGDWVAYDQATNTVWLAQSPDNNVVVINAATDAIAATIPNIGNANGIALTPQYAFVADVTNDTVDVIDKTTFAVVARIPVTGTTPDGVMYIPNLNEIAVASDDNNVEDFINVATLAQTSSLQLLPNPAVSGPDVSLYVPSKGLLYQPDDKQMDVINPSTGAIVNTFTLVTSGTVKPAVYDPVTNTLLVGTTNNQMLVVNADTGAILSTIAIPGSVDETAIDVNARLAYVGDKSGVVDVINLDTRTLVGQLPSEANAHTLTVNPNNADVFVYEGNSNTVSVYAPTATINADTIYRYFDKIDGSHFFTSSASEAATIAATRPDLVQEQNGFGAIDPSSHDSNAVSVYRFFETTNGTHFFTDSASERDSVIASRPDLKFEGVAFNEDANPVVGDVAVYRYFDSTNGTHLYTSSSAEVASIAANSPQLKSEGIAFWAPPSTTVTG